MAGTGDPVALCAAGEYRFYASAYRALGLATRVVDGVWSVVPAAPRQGAGAVDDGRPSVFPVAGTLLSQAHEAAVLAAPVPPLGMVHDAWSRLDLSASGFEREPASPWMVRAPAPAERLFVPGLRIVRATTAPLVLTVERTLVTAAGGPPRGYREGSIHPGGATAAEPDLHLLLGLLDGVPVATSMAAVDPACVLVSGVATLPYVRGRGIGAAMTAAALGVAPDRPAVLGTSALGRGVYRRLGFVEVSTPTHWTRVASA